MFELEYKLIPLDNQPQGDMVLEGLLTHTAGNENQLDEVKEMDVNFDDLDQDQKKDLLMTGRIPIVQQAIVQKPKPKPPVVIPSGSSDKTIVNTRVLSAGAGVYFRVQVAATQNAFDARTHFRNGGVDQEVLVEQNKGLYKYTVGSFPTYDQAMAYRNRVERLSLVNGAFVIAYRDGKRIPVTSVRQY